MNSRTAFLFGVYFERTCGCLKTRSLGTLAILGKNERAALRTLGGRGNKQKKKQNPEPTNIPTSNHQLEVCQFCVHG